jgi:hypothetical protein
VIANLHSCLYPGGRYKLNIEAFVRHSANFRSDVIQDMMAQLGIERLSTRLRRVPVFFEYLKAQYPERNLTLTSTELNEINAYQILDDLAERRNAVAHGTSSDILSTPFLLQYVDFCEVYGKALYEIVREESLPLYAAHLATEIGSPIKVFNNKIVCIKLRNVFVGVGDTLIAKPPKGVYFSGAIERLEVDGEPYDFVPSQPDVDVGMMVSFHAKGNQKFYLLYDKARWLDRRGAKDKYSLMDDGELRQVLKRSVYHPKRNPGGCRPAFCDECGKVSVVLDEPDIAVCTNPQCVRTYSPGWCTSCGGITLHPDCNLCDDCISALGYD